MSPIDKNLLLKSRFADYADVAVEATSFEDTRFELLCKFANGRRVLHIGCTDHEGLIDIKMSNGSWLHGALEGVASKIVGVDINGPLIEVLRNRGVTSVYYFDLLGSEPWTHELDFDLVLVPDVIEHLGNASQFIGAIRSRFPHADLVVSVPNAFSFANFLAALKNKERINLDHRAWYSPFTLIKSVTTCGYDVTQLHFCSMDLRNAKRTWRAHVRRRIERTFPLLSQCLVASFKPVEK